MSERPVAQNVLFGGGGAAAGSYDGGNDLEMSDGGGLTFYSPASGGAGMGMDAGSSGGGAGGGGGHYGDRGGFSGSISPSQNNSAGGAFNIGSESSFDDEPPLLEELGINFDHIRDKTIAVLSPHKPLRPEVMQDTDLAGPLFFCLCLGFCLLLTGKVHFGYIYGFGVTGCIAMYVLLSLMSEDGLDINIVVSALGYCLLPIVVMAVINIVVSLKGAVGAVVAPLCIAWCTITATRFIEQACGMREQRYLIAYPTTLLFSIFAMITVF